VRSRPSAPSSVLFGVSSRRPDHAVAQRGSPRSEDSRGIPRRPRRHDPCEAGEAMLAGRTVRSPALVAGCLLAGAVACGGEALQSSDAGTDAAYPAAPGTDAGTIAAYGDATPGTDAETDSGCIPLEGANYDQSCTKDSDCEVIAQGSPCDCGYVCGVDFGAINVSANAQYLSVLRREPSSTGIGCGCPKMRGDPIAVCVGGTCQVSISLDAVADAGSAVGSACAASGGTCKIGSVMWNQAPSSAQDCSANPPDPGGGVCCLRPSTDASPPSPAEGGAPDGCTNECSLGDHSCPKGESCCLPLPGLAGCNWCGGACPG
jgi:hypothetical protein